MKENKCDKISSPQCMGV